MDRYNIEVVAAHSFVTQLAVITLVRMSGIGPAFVEALEQNVRTFSEVGLATDHAERFLAQVPQEVDRIRQAVL